MIADSYKEDEIQTLITLAELSFPVESPNNNSYKPFPKNIAEAQAYFRRFLLDQSGAYQSLQSKGLVSRQQEQSKLTATGKRIAEEIRTARPPIYYWYRDFYSAIENSNAFDDYSRKVFGRNLGQQGFSDMSQIHLMLNLVPLNSSSSVLDIGCGNGKIAEYISDLTGASVTGLDYIPEAIEQAKRRTASKKERLHFELADFTTTTDIKNSFDIILSVDTIYFGDAKTILGLWKKMLNPHGRLVIFYLSMDGSDLQTSLKEKDLSCDVYDLSKENWEHQKLKHKVATELQEAFEAEGNAFVWKNLMRESVSNQEPYSPAVTRIRRYLYVAGLVGSLPGA